MIEIEKISSLLKKARDMEETDCKAALSLYFEADESLQRNIFEIGKEIPNEYRFFFKQVTEGYKRLGFNADEAVV